MHLARLATRIPSKAVHAATHAALHPVQTAGYAYGLARGVVAGTVGVVETLRSPGHAQTPPPPHESPEEPASAPAPTPGTMAEEAANEPGYVVPPPSSAPPAEPPIDVVGEALAAEEAGEPPLLGGMQGEPHPVTREEEHEGAPLTRAELDEIEDETDEALNPDDEDVIPDQGLVLDPGVAKAVRSEAAILQDAADPDKG